MTFFIQLRTRVRHFIASNEELVLRILRFLLVLVAMIIMNHSFGYQRLLNHWWVSIGIAVLSFFIPLAGSTFVVLFVGLMHLMTLSSGVAVVALILIAVSYALAAYFHADDSYDLIFVPACRYLRVPFLVPLESALLRSAHELPLVICGTIFSYYLKVVTENSAAFLDTSVDFSVSDMIQNQILGDGMFYIYLLAMTALFLVIYNVRTKGIEHAWLIAVISGVLTEFLIMLGGTLFLGDKSDIPLLIVGNVVTILVGLLLVFFARGFDYSRTEHVQFEDDEYYYYVTAVPKMHIPEQEKEVKRITS